MAGYLVALFQRQDAATIATPHRQAFFQGTEYAGLVKELREAQRLVTVLLVEADEVVRNAAAMPAPESTPCGRSVISKLPGGRGRRAWVR